MVPALCVDKRTAAGCAGGKGRTRKIGEESRTWLGVWDPVPVHNTTSRPADDQQITVATLSNSCSVVLIDVESGGHGIYDLLSERKSV